MFQAAFTILEALAEVISVIGGMGLLIDAPQFVLKYIIFGKYGDAAPKVRGIFASYRAILPLWMIRRYSQTRVTRVYFEFFTRSHLYFSFGQVGFHLERPEAFAVRLRQQWFTSIGSIITILCCRGKGCRTHLSARGCAGLDGSLGVLGTPRHQAHLRRAYGATVVHGHRTDGWRAPSYHVRAGRTCEFCTNFHDIRIQELTR